MKPKVRTSNKWTDADNAQLLELYITKSNSEIAEIIGRTPDAVRKQLNKLTVKRPLKADLKKISKKTGKLEFFSNLKKGHKVKQKLEIIDNNIARQTKLMKNEVEWAKKNLDIPEQKKEKPKEKEKPLRIDSRTVMYVPYSWDLEKCQEFKQNYLKKQLSEQIEQYGSKDNRNEP
ncbi:MAG: hypothetical protein EKK63_01705 [Acinetobacter sp.]|uniref:hypothetical protein n=1 Tax=Acinetobacter sp. TaxID=472 RepID=UPI000FB35C71|nr:hypothetical protein [Acinetobacter sp.]RUP42320.1 MAG: hypothetical protein EKK63_01705 [Acinetobacter sp.]